MKPDILSIVEAAYAGDASVDAHLRRLADAAAPTLDMGLGVYAHGFELAADGRLELRGGMHGAGQADATYAELSTRIFNDFAGSAEGRPIVGRIYRRAPGVGSFVELSGLAPSQLNFDGVPSGAADAIAMIAGDPSGHGIVIHAPTTSRARMKASQRALYVRVAVHLAAGYRLLRNRIAAVDAVIAPDGRILHAEHAARAKAARQALTESTRNIDRARGRMRRASPEQALAVWKGLIAGAWSLVDHVDSDGRRYIFAKRNAPEVCSWHDLTDRERQVVAYAAEGAPHKVIAYELGIAESTVCAHLQRAAAKIGAPSRIALLQRYRSATDAQPRDLEPRPAR